VKVSLFLNEKLQHEDASLVLMLGPDSLQCTVHYRVQALIRSTVYLLFTCCTALRVYCTHTDCAYCVCLAGGHVAPGTEKPGTIRYYKPDGSVEKTEVQALGQLTLQRRGALLSEYTLIRHSH
jgi:hypothetical protein